MKSKDDQPQYDPDYYLMFPSISLGLTNRCHMVLAGELGAMVMIMFV